MHMREINPLSGSEARKAVAANVRVELARAQVSGAQMAQHIGIPGSTFSRRMTGDTSFAAEEIAAIAAALGISTDALLTGVVTAAETAVAA
jgi:transcriptional regulator with XRE-family HTH domain